MPIVYQTRTLKSSRTLDNDRMARFTSTVTPLAANAVWISDVLNIISEDTIRGIASSDQAGVVNVEYSTDGTTWKLDEAISVVANVDSKFDITTFTPFLRFRYVNGSAAQNTFSLRVRASYQGGIEHNSGGGGGEATGPAGGDLSGTYPNPTIPGLANKRDIVTANAQVYVVNGGGLQTSFGYSSGTAINSIAQRTATGTLQAAPATFSTEAVVKSQLDTKVNSSTALSSVYATTAAGLPSLIPYSQVGAVSTIMRRDPAGRSQVVPGVSGNDIAVMSQLQSATVDLYAPTGWLRQNIDRRTAANLSAVQLVSGKATGPLIALRQGDFVQKVGFVSNTVNTGQTHLFAYLYNITTSTVVAITADQGTTSWANGNLNSYNFTTPYTVPTDGLYYVGLCVVATTIGFLLGNLSDGTAGVLLPAMNTDVTGSYTTPASFPTGALTLTTNINNFVYMLLG